MIRILICLSFILACNLLNAKPQAQSDSNLAPCFSVNEVEQVGKQINELLKHEFCEAQIDPKKFASISRNILPQIMTENFLGIAPPENWQQLSDDIIKNCLENKNLCKKEARKEFEECLKPRVPIILVQYASWFSEHCSQLNKSLIQQWPDKKTVLEKMINDSKKLNK